jgi:phosphoribosyl 1,2-cyclic phosphodiesterase
MLREQINRLDAMLFTHSHKDHIAGLDDVRAYNFLQQADMPVYGNADVLAQLKTEFYYAFEKNKYPGIPQLRLHEITAPFSIGSDKNCSLTRFTLSITCAWDLESKTLATLPMPTRYLRKH